MPQTKAESRPKSASSSSSNSGGNQPVHSIRHGRIKAAIWENPSDNGVFHNVTIHRSYKDGETWKDSSSFGYDDLTVAAKLLLDCHTWITQQRSGEKGESQRA